MNVAHYQRHQTLNLLPRARALIAAWPRRRKHTLKTQNAECAPPCREIRLRNLPNAFKSHDYILQARTKPHLRPLTPIR